MPPATNHEIVLSVPVEVAAPGDGPADLPVGARPVDPKPRVSKRFGVYVHGIMRAVDDVDHARILTLARVGTACADGHVVEAVPVEIPQPGDHEIVQPGERRL